MFYGIKEGLEMKMKTPKRTSGEVFKELRHAVAEFGNALIMHARSDRKKLAKAFRKIGKITLRGRE